MVIWRPTVLKVFKQVNKWSLFVVDLSVFGTHLLS